ncbi:hypothetical protein QBC37DRAFT_381454 [Rhypophila decipiens]|uniref:Uncharacterized protein n=1 Tax=Rhypophila decipiens TaxID=261697 RepID=A0AAN7B0S3_9PEZI|nr:hypothetical protein QBC37DRAFT_381454 [Rhypophila decipiens]
MSDKEERQIRLLLAILEQKCFQDAWPEMKWAEVARHPLLSEDNVKGHAIRIRYSRISKKFKPKKHYSVSKTKKDLPRTLSVDIEGAAEISNESDVDGPEPREDQPEQPASGCWSSRPFLVKMITRNRRR